jgi:PAS domain S-box-containing protein
MESQAIKVLLVEDSAVDVRFVEALLVGTRSSGKAGSDFELTPADTFSAARLRLLETEFDVLLLDLGLPDCRGLETVQRIRSVNPEVPVVVLTASDDEEMAVRTVQEGAQDYLVKGQFDRRSLVRALRYAIERKRSADELTQSEANTEALLNAVPDLILVFDKEGRCIRTKPADGFTAPGMDGDVLGKTLYELLPSPVTAEARFHVKAIETSGQPQGFEYGTEGPSGERFFEVRMARAAGKGFLAIVREITGRKRAEQGLRSALEWQETMFDGSRDAIFVSDVDSRFVVVNRAACELTGFSREELLTMRIPDLHEDVDLEAYRTYHDGIMAGQELVSEAKILRRDGAKLDAEFSNRRISVSGTDYMHTSARDISERKLAEDALRESEEKYRSILESIEDGYYEVDLQGNSVFANDSLGRILGTSPGDMRGSNYRNWVTPETAENIYGRFHEVFNSGVPAKGAEYEIRSSDGSRKFVEMSVSLMRDSAGRPAGFRGILRDTTERRQVEEALRESEERYRNLFENATIGIYRTTPEGKILLANPAMLRMLGYETFEALSARNLEQEGFEPDYSRARFKELIEEQGEIKGLEAAWIRADGTSLYVSENARAIRTHDGEIAYYEGTVEDITKRRETQLALQESEERYRLLIENSTDIVSIIGVDGKVRYQSASLERALGYTPEERKGRKPIEFVHPDDREKWDRTLRDVADYPNQEHHLEYRYRHADGSWRTLESIAKPLKDGDRVVGVASYTRDITERKRAEALMRQQSAYMKASMDGIAIHDDNGRLVYVNDAFLNLNGYDDARELVGRGWPLLIARREVARLRDEVGNNQESPFTRAGQWRGEAIGRRRNGSVYPVEISLTKIAGGGFVSVVRDLTESKQLEAERYKAEVELKAFAEKLERSNRELQDFAYIASHDLQEPLRKIMAFGDRLRAKCAQSISAEGLDYLERMQNAASRMQVLINDLLTFSRVTTKARPFVPVDLNEVARNVLSDLEVRIEQVQGTVEVDHLPTIDADSVQMHQLLQNLVGNALKFHRKGVPPAVKVRVAPPAGVPGNGNSTAVCQLLVEDNGIGFEERYLDRIFTVFQRLHGRGEYEGTGIGLAICRKITERHGGSITARSRLDAGTSFIVTLPVRQPKGEVPQ